MNKKIVALLLAFVMIMGLIPVGVFATDNVYYVGAEDFYDKGTFTLVNREAGAFGYILRAAGGSKPETTKNAVTSVKIPSDGDYTFYVRVRDYKEGVDANGTVIKQGVRLCKLKVNGVLLDNAVGNHGNDAYAWQEAGKISLKSGEIKIEIVDTSANYARIEAVAFTTSKDKPNLPNDAGGLSNALSSKHADVIKYEVEEEKPEAPPQILPEGETPEKVKTYFLGADAFASNLGTWLSPGKDGSVLPVLRSPGGQKPDKTQNAITAFNVELDGTYFLWAWTRDYGDGIRNLKVAVDGKITEQSLGAHLKNGYAWEYCGSIELKAGKVQVEVVDSANNYGRLEGIILTNDPKYIPEETTAVEKYKVSADGKGLVSNITGTIPTAQKVEPDKELLNDGHTYIVVTAQDFTEENQGSWKPSTIVMGSPLPYIMMSAADGKAHLAEPAHITVTVPKTGIYKLFVRSHDSAANSGRKFLVSVGGLSDKECGVHGKDWGFESVRLPLIAGENEIKITDHTGNYGRWDMIILTDNQDFVPDNSAMGIKKLAAMADMRPTKVEESSQGGRPDDEIAVNLNGEYMNFDVSPLLINDRTMVPFRAIFEALGCTVGWEDETRTAYGTRNGKTVCLVIDSAEAKVGSEKVSLDSPATLVNSRTVVPLRFVSEALGAYVSWEDKTQTVWIAAEIPPEVIMLTAESFFDTGTWELEGASSGSFESGAIKGITADTPEEANPALSKPAKANIELAGGGTYKVFAHCKDYTTSYPGKRTFAVNVDGKQVGNILGNHGTNGFAWQEAGTVNLEKGAHLVELVDTSGFWARCDMVILTNGLDYKPSSAYSELMAVASPVKATGAEAAEYPMYAREAGEVKEQYTIKNDKVKVNFYLVNTSNGPVVQTEIADISNGTEILTNKRSEQNGYMVVRSDSAVMGATPQDRYVFSSKYKSDGKDSAYMGVDVYKAGVSSWMIPDTVERVSDTAVKMTATSNLGTISSVWEIEEGSQFPKVTVTASFNIDGYYTIGCAEGDELTYNDFYFALAPFRVQSKRVDQEGGIYTEQYLFTPMGCYTLTENNKYSSEKITKGVVVDPEFTELKWVKRADTGYGISMKGADNGYQASVFAPILGSENSNLSAGESYSFTYRVVSTVSDWFDNYKNIVSGLYGVDSYRQNTYSTLNQAIFNTRKFSLDDEHSGWDDLDKGYWNIESKNTVALADPMQAMQTYLLTEDTNYLEKRSLPTLVSFMTRGVLQFNSKGGLEKSNGYVNIDKIPYAIGDFVNVMNMNVKGGMYELNRGRTPYILNSGIENTLAGKNVNGYNSMTPFSDDMYMYKYTGEKKYLDEAIKKADAYLEDTVYAPQEKQIDFTAFVYTNYYPNLPALMDMYELTGEERYLDAAYYTAQYLLTTLWVPGVDGDKKKEQLTVNNGIKATSNGVHDWYGGEQRIVGKDNTTDYTETVESWVVSRVGLGLEQASTFYGNQSSTNIMMSMWVGDILKLAAYKNDEFLANAAENAVVGRFSNYPGYYYGYIGFTSTQMKERYPYDGPDVTAIYYHHIPPFMAMLEDFIVNQAFYRSGQKVKFPYVRQSGYAYFNSNHYGFEAGNVYDETDMWLWLDENVLESGNLQIDWLGARKDGKAAFMLMNQSSEDVTTTITFGEKMGEVTDGYIYTQNGEKQAISIEGGKATVTVPKKGITTIVVNAPEVKAPAFSEFTYELKGEKQDMQNTAYNHGNGKAIVLQATPENYYVYVYVTDKPATTKEVEITYTAGDKTETLKTSDYPYEFIIKVDNPDAEFTYDLKTTPKDGSGVKTIKGGTVKPLK